MTDISSAVTFLLAAQGPEGGWGYRPGQAATVEATAAVILALSHVDGAGTAVDTGLDWLARAQHADGGWGCALDDPQSGWATAWGVLALAGLDGYRSSLDRGVDWLLQSEPGQYAAVTAQQIRQVAAIDLSLQGWPWLPHQAAWVEPTALAMLSLAAVPQRQAAVDRRQQGLRFLLDRRCPAGGWNVGNPSMFGQALPARACPTAWALLALAAVDESAIRAQDREALLADALQDDGSLALAWASLALRSLGQLADSLMDRLSMRQLANGSWDRSPYATAVALLANHGVLRQKSIVAVPGRPRGPSGKASVLPSAGRAAGSPSAGNAAKPVPAAANLVALGTCASYQEDISSCLQELWRLAEMPSLNGARVLVKPNLVDWPGHALATTDPAVVAAVLDLLLAQGARQVLVGDGPTFRRDALPVARASGLAPVLAARGVPFVDLNYDECQAIPAPGPWFPDHTLLWLPRSVLEADVVVSVPKLKTHHWTGVSLSLKNLLGLLPGARYGWPKNIIHVNGIARTIAGLHQALPQVVTVVDGIVGMEGDGPLFGSPVAHGLLAAGSDPVAVDVICARLMGYAIPEVDHLLMAAFAYPGRVGSVHLRGTPRQELQRSYQRPPVLENPGAPHAWERAT